MACFPGGFRRAPGHPVVPLHPNIVKACRSRYRAAGGKTDPGDGCFLRACHAAAARAAGRFSPPDDS
jgi:hypothetical protein